MATIFPFTAIVGQDRMKRALILNAIHPQIGGVLIRGERGTAKSTAARALAAILPEIDVIGDDQSGFLRDKGSFRIVFTAAAILFQEGIDSVNNSLAGSAHQMKLFFIGLYT